VKRIALLLACFAVNAFGQVPVGDSDWAQRAEGRPRVDAAIAAYEKAIAVDPDDLEAHWKLLRAFRFKGAYLAESRDEKKKIYTAAKSAGDTALAAIERKAKTRGPEKGVADALRSTPHAAEVFYWDAAVWGEWALVYGKLAAAREGVADRIKRHATIAMLIDPKAEGGGGARILGRLHHQTPRIPFLTGWASDALAVKYLEESLAHDPTNKLTRVWLAEAMVAVNPRSKPRATRMLREVVDSPNDEDYIVEQKAAVEDAKALLAGWKRQ